MFKEIESLKNKIQVMWLYQIRNKNEISIMAKETAFLLHKYLIKSRIEIARSGDLMIIKLNLGSINFEIRTSRF